MSAGGFVWGPFTVSCLAWLYPELHYRYTGREVFHIESGGGLTFSLE